MPKQSILQNKDAVAEAIAHSSSIKEALAYLNLRGAGGNYKSFKTACLKHDLSIPQWDRAGQLQALAKNRVRSNDDVFVVDSDYNNRGNIKKRMFAIGIPNICNECGQPPVWNGKPLTLQLDHINGVWNDNRIENLRILCGHCHSQTSTFCGGNK